VDERAGAGIGEGRTPMPRWWFAVPVVLVVAAVLALGLRAFNDRYVVSGLRPFKCGTLGGSVPPEFAALASFKGAYQPDGPLATAQGSGWIYVASDVSERATGRTLGAGVWATRDTANAVMEPVDALAAQVSAKPVAFSGNKQVMTAARLCLHHR
jgi:hypothetical protein